MEVVYMLCPSHDENDQRINRVYKVLKDKYVVIRFYERAYRKFGNGNDNIVYLESKREFFKRSKIFCEEHKNVKMYIHDSGSFGLLLCKRWSKSKDISDVIFDYHDWIPWEIAYQVSKFTMMNRSIKLTSALLLRFHRLYFRDIGITKLVGISSEQTDAFKRDYHLNNVDTLVVPNLRPRMSISRNSTRKSLDGVLWIGNIMRGRDLALLSSFLAKFNEHNSTSVKLFVIGNIYDKDYFVEISNSSHMVYLGGFTTDRDIHLKTKDYNLVGFFYGWIDTYQTDINRIASPNKVFSYLNLKIPVILGKHLKAVKNLLGQHKDSVFWVEDYSGFSEVISILSKGYGGFLQNSIPEVLDSQQVEKKIAAFFD